MDGRLEEQLTNIIPLKTLLRRVLRYHYISWWLNLRGIRRCLYSRINIKGNKFVLFKSLRKYTKLRPNKPKKLN